MLCNFLKSFRSFYALTGKASVFLFLFVFDANLCAKEWSLEEARARVLEKNHEILAKEFSLQAVEEQKKQSLAAYLPSLDFQAKLIRSNARAFYGDSEQTSSKLTLSQMLFSSPLYYAIRKSTLNNSLASQEKSELRARLLLQLRQSYYSCVLRSEELQVHVENIEILQEALDIEKAQEALGHATDFDVEQAKLALSQAFSLYYEADKNLKVAKQGFKQVLSLEDYEEISLKDEKILIGEELEQKLVLIQDPQVLERPQIYTFEELQSWQALAEKQNPLLQSLKTQEALTSLELHEKRAEYYPSLQAFATYETLRPQSPSSAYFDHVNVGLSLSWNLFDSFSRESRQRQARFQLSQQKELQAAVLLDLQSNIWQRLLEIEESLLTYRVAQEAVFVADSALEKGRHRRDLGSITAISYRELLASRRQAKLSLSRAAFHLLLSYFSLQALVGESL